MLHEPNQNTDKDVTTEIEAFCYFQNQINPVEYCIVVSTLL